MFIQLVGHRIMLYLIETVHYMLFQINIYAPKGLIATERYRMLVSIINFSVWWRITPIYLGWTGQCYIDNSQKGWSLLCAIILYQQRGLVLSRIILFYSCLLIGDQILVWIILCNAALSTCAINRSLFYWSSAVWSRRCKCWVICHV